MSTKTPGKLCNRVAGVVSARLCRVLSGPGKIDPSKRQSKSHEAGERERRKKDPEHCSRTLSLASFRSGQPAPQLSLLRFERESTLRNDSRKPCDECRPNCLGARER